MFSDIYKNKTVMVTGHTGFKGAWLTTWLLKLGANVVGVSKDVPTTPSMFEINGLSGRIKHIFLDIRDREKVREVIDSEKPDFLFHLAAQAIVSVSYADPVNTMTTNVVGTMNILDALRGVKKNTTAIFITSDKCYDNVEWVWGYRETDALGGKDVYSGSKGAAELVIKSYVHSFFTNEHPVTISIGRAGNVIGGGDWAKDRIVVDCINAWSGSRKVEVRSPQATRPWQHVLEPLSGYLKLGEAAANSKDLHGEAFNFGPRSEQNQSVVRLLEDLSHYWGFERSSDSYEIVDNRPFHEAGLLKLNCDKALVHLKWEPTLVYDETIRFTGDWYSGFYRDNADMYHLTVSQICAYESLAKNRLREWAVDIAQD